MQTSTTNNSNTSHNQTIETNLKAQLIQFGFQNPAKIANTLQGSIWRAIHKSSKQSMVIKVTNKYLHSQSMTFITGKQTEIKENILIEKKILKFLTCDKSEGNKVSQHITKYNGFLTSNLDYFLVMEDGGFPLFEFCVKAHKLIASGRLEISEWHKLVKIIFKQMIECIDYIHSQNVCHLDISLENFLINDVEAMWNSNGKMTFCNLDTVHIKLCDFGLAHLFSEEKPDFMSSKFVGKTNYKSHEVTIGKQPFNAKKNDVWCLGVCLFMLIIGAGPWISTSTTDLRFVRIMNGDIVGLLHEWNKLHYVNTELIMLFVRIFQFENQRCSLSDIQKFKWLSS